MVIDESMKRKLINGHSKEHEWEIKAGTIEGSKDGVAVGSWRSYNEGFCKDGLATAKINLIIIIIRDPK